MNDISVWNDSFRGLADCVVNYKLITAMAEPRELQVKPISQLRFDYDTTTIRRCYDAFDYDGTDRNYDLRSIRLRCDHTTTRKIDMLFFLLASNRVQ